MTDPGQTKVGAAARDARDCTVTFEDVCMYVEPAFVHHLERPFVDHVIEVANARFRAVHPVQKVHVCRWIGDELWRLTMPLRPSVGRS